MLGQTVKPNSWVQSSRFLGGFSGLVVRFEPGFGLFLAEQVRSSGFLEEFECVWGSVLVDEPGFEWVRISTCLVQSSSKLIIFGFNPTLFMTYFKNHFRHPISKLHQSFWFSALFTTYMVIIHIILCKIYPFTCYEKGWIFLNYYFISLVVRDRMCDTVTNFFSS